MSEEAASSAVEHGSHSLVAPDAPRSDAPAASTEGAEATPPVLTDEERRKRIWGGVFNMMNYIVGAGVLGLPYAFAQVGWLVGAVIIALVAASTLLAYKLMLNTMAVTGAYSYEAMARAVGGERLSHLVMGVIVVDSFGFLTAYTVLIGDNLAELVGQWGTNDSIWANRYLLTILVLGVVVGPLSTIHDISKLGFTSLLSLVPLVYYLGMQIVLLLNGGLGPAVVAVTTDPGGFFVALPIMAFAFTSIQALFPMWADLREKGGVRADVDRVSRITVALTTVVYLTAAWSGYLAYGSNTRGNVLLNYPANGFSDFLLFAMTASIVLSYPVILFPCRIALSRMLFPNTNETQRRFLLTNLAIIIVSFLVAVLIPSFATVLGLVGALTSTATGFLFPALFYLRVGSGPAAGAHAGAPGEATLRRAAWVLLVVGGGAGLVSAVITIVRYITSVSSSSS